MLDVIVSLLCDPDQVESIKPLYMRCSDFVKLTGVNQTITKKYKRVMLFQVNEEQGTTRYESSSYEVEEMEFGFHSTKSGKQSRKNSTRVQISTGTGLNVVPSPLIGVPQPQARVSLPKSFLYLKAGTSN